MAVMLYFKNAVGRLEFTLVCNLVCMRQNGKIPNEALLNETSL